MAIRLSSLRISTDCDIFGADPLFEIDSSEKRLLCAVLKRALEDHVMPDRLVMNKLNTKTIQHIQKQAEFWIRNYESHEIGSIRWILEYISNDPDSAHKSILKMIDNPELKGWLKENCATHRVYPIVRRKAVRDRNKIPKFRKLQK